MPGGLTAAGEGGPPHLLQIGEEHVVPGCGGPSRVVPRSKTAELGPEDDGLQLVEAGVDALLLVLVAPFASVVAQGPSAPLHLAGAGHHRARVTIGAEVLRRVEAGRRHVTDGARPHAAACRSLRLGGVLDEHGAELVCQLPQLRQRGKMAVQVDRHDRPCPGTGAARRVIGVEQQ